MIKAEEIRKKMRISHAKMDNDINDNNTNLSDEEKKQLLSGAVLRIYKKDSYIYGMTDACLGMIYVQKGSIRVYITSEEGREITLFHIGSGECCVLSASCVIAGISLDVQLLAEEDTEIVAIHSGMIQKLMDGFFGYQAV